MRIITAFLLLLLALVLVAIAALTIIDYMVPKEKFRLEFDFNVVAPKKGGFNLDKDKLHFGDIAKTGRGTRWLHINNSNEYAQRVEILVATDRDAAKYFSINPPSQTIIPPKQVLDFRVDVSVPRSAAPEHHQGTIFVHIYKAYPWQKYTKSAN